MAKKQGNPEKKGEKNNNTFFRQKIKKIYMVNGYIHITQRYKYKLFMAGSNAGNYAIIKHLM